MHGCARKQAFIPLLAAAAFAAAWLVYALAPEAVYLDMVRLLGIVPGPFPFLDTHMVLSSRECSAFGIDPFIVNPCDVWGRPFLYAPVMLWGAGPHEIAANGVVGLILVAGFILSLLCLPRPGDRQSMILTILAVLSPATAFAVERGNFELLIFAFVAVAGRLLLRGVGARLLGYALMLIVALFKFFPAVLFALTLRERPRLLIAVNAVAGAALVTMVAWYRDDLKLAAINLPQHDYFRDMFGAITLPFGLTTLFPGLSGTILLGGLVTALLAVSVWLAFNASFAEAYAALAEDERTFLIIGGILMVGAFFAGQSVIYRAIHLIFVMPGLCAMAQAQRRLRFSPLFAATACIVLALLWTDVLRLDLSPDLDSWDSAFTFWFVHEVGWWFVTTVLAAVLVRFAAESVLGSGVLRSCFGVFMPEMRVLNPKLFAETNSGDVRIS